MEEIKKMFEEQISKYPREGMPQTLWYFVLDGEEIESGSYKLTLESVKFSKAKKHFDKLSFIPFGTYPHRNKFFPLFKR